MDALANCEISMGGRVLCAGGEFVLDHETESYLTQHMKMRSRWLSRQMMVRS